jgi:hypothetical protein
MIAYILICLLSLLLVSVSIYKLLESLHEINQNRIKKYIYISLLYFLFVVIAVLLIIPFFGKFTITTGGEKTTNPKIIYFKQ